MYERFTDRARKALSLAIGEAYRHAHEYVGPEHILLGICKLDGASIAVTIIGGAGINLGAIRAEVEKLMTPVPDKITMGRLPHTTESKRVIESAIDHARAMGSGCVGTEHLLLGLIAVPNTIASAVLATAGLTIDGTMAAIKGIAGGGKASMKAEPFQNFFRLAGAAPDLLASLEVMTCLARFKYGNLDKDAYVEIEKAEAAIAKAKGVAT